MAQKTQRPATYPWAELYELESRTRPLPRTKKFRRGRPPRPIEREKVTIELTDEERRILRAIHAALAGRLPSVSQGQVVGLALRLLEARMLAIGKPLALPEDITDWRGLLTLLEEEVT